MIPVRPNIRASRTAGSSSLIDGITDRRKCPEISLGEQFGHGSEIPARPPLVHPTASISSSTFIIRVVRIPMRDLLGLDLPDLSEIILLEVRALLGRRVVVLSHVPSRLAPVFAVIDHLTGMNPNFSLWDRITSVKPLAWQVGQTFTLLALPAAVSRLLCAAVVKRDLRQAARALKDLAIDRVARHGLAAAAIATCLVEPVDLASGPLA